MRDEVPKYPIGPIVEHLGGEVPAKRGAWTKMRCFLHEDRSPSATINFDLNRYFCWSCGVNEDGIGLIQHVEGCSFATARDTAEAVAGTGDLPVRAGTAGGHGPRTRFGLFD